MRSDPSPEVQFDGLFVLQVVDARLPGQDATDAGELHATIGQRRVQGAVMPWGHGEAELVVVAPARASCQASMAGTASCNTGRGRQVEIDLGPHAGRLEDVAEIRRQAVPERSGALLASPRGA